MKVVDENETQKATKKKQKQRQKRAREIEAIVKEWELIDFAVHLS